MFEMGMLVVVVIGAQTTKRELAIQVLWALKEDYIEPTSAKCW